MTSDVPLKHTGNNASRQTRWAFMKWFDIPSKTRPGMVYLRRLRMIQTPWFGLYLHFIYEPDTDQHPHDHPWTFWSFIVRGEYCEERHERMAHRDWYMERKFHTARSLHKFALDWAHRITYIAPGTITLVAVGPRSRPNWGFWTSDGKVPWQAYNNKIETGQSDDPFDS